MEKQEAIDFIITEIGKQRSEAEVIADLCGLLGAPQDIVEHFVSRTLSNRTYLEPEVPIVETPAPESDAHNILPDEHGQDEVADFSEESKQEPGIDPQLEAPAPLVEDNRWVEEIHPTDEIQSGEEILLQEQLDLGAVSSQPEDMDSISEILSIEDRLQVEDTQFDKGVPSDTPVRDPDALVRKAFEPLSPGEKARLEKGILSALAKQRRQSDVVMMVSDRTGMSWDQAQRLVTEVSMTNRKKLNKREGGIQIFLSLLAILVGLALIFLVLGEFYTFYSLFTQPEAASVTTYSVLDRYTIWVGVVGILLFLGGITGMVLGIRKRFD